MGENSDTSIPFNLKGRVALPAVLSCRNVITTVAHTVTVKSWPRDHRDDLTLTMYCGKD